MNDTLWAVAQAIQNERNAAIEECPLPEATDVAHPFQVGRLLATALPAAALVARHAAMKLMAATGLTSMRSGAQRWERPVRVSSLEVCHECEVCR